MTTKLKSPPINELIIGHYFDQPIFPLRSEHIGLFWAELRSVFPTIQQQPELSPPIIGTSASFQIALTDEPYPMPRYWLVSEDGTIILQIQKNAFILNWRKRDREYPHFEAVKASFSRYYDRYVSFLAKELNVNNLNIQVVDLTYSNIVERGEYWNGVGDTSKILPDFRMLDPHIQTEGKPEFNHVTVHRIGSDMNLTITSRSGRKTSDPSSELLVIEFRALGALGTASKFEADDWLTRAHEIIGNCFTAVTNADIREHHWNKG